MNKLAQINFHDGSGYTGFGQLGLENPTGTPDVIFQRLISSTIGILSLVAIIWFVFIIITGGISYMSAGADAKATEAARKRISNGLIGLVITIFGIFIVVFVAEILGLNSLLNIPFLIESTRIR